MDKADSTDNLINESAVQYQPPPNKREEVTPQCTLAQVHKNADTHTFLQSLENSKNVCRSAVGFQSTR